MRYTPEDREEFAKQIGELLHQGLIQPSNSPHSSPAFIVRNHAERGKARMVINYKALNDNTTFDGYYLPNKDELIYQVRNSKLFSKVDCKSGFWQIMLDDQSKPYTAFSCPQGHYEWNVMPFGLKKAPQIFQRRMDNIFREDRDLILVYIDDILVHSKTTDVHNDHLKYLIKKCQNHGIGLSKRKALLCQTSREFLGLELDQGQVKLQPHVLSKILNDIHRFLI